MRGGQPRRFEAAYRLAAERRLARLRDPDLCRAALCWRIRLARSSSRRRDGGRFRPARLMKNWIMRIPEPSPLGDTRLLAIVRAICCAEPEKVLGGGAVDAVFTLPDQRLPARRRLLLPVPRLRGDVAILLTRGA